MARKKRSEKLGVIPVKERPKARPAVSTAPAGLEYRQVACPVCGIAHGTRGGENFWRYTRDFDPDKPFGIIQEVGLGRGHSFRVIGNFGPEDEPETFELVKSRLLQAVKEWRDKGWISNEEISLLLA